jgi:hypothetical protein
MVAKLPRKIEKRKLEKKLVFAEENRGMFENAIYLRCLN